MALTKVTGKGITCSAVTEDKLGTSSVTTNKIGPDAVTSAKINNGSVTADDLASTLDLSSKTVTLASDLVSDLKRPVQDNIALLGFKMAVNDGLTVFNLVDGVVDEFNDESGTDEAEGSNDLYNTTDDYYINSNSPTGSPFASPASAGFSINSITEPDTSVAQTNPTTGCGTAGSFTVPSCVTSLTAYVFGSGGGGGGHLPQAPYTSGGGGGFVTGTLAVTPTQVLEVTVGEGGYEGDNGEVVWEAAYGGTSHPGAPGCAAEGYGVSPFQGGGGSVNPAAFAGLGGGLSAVATSADAGFPSGAPSIPGIALIAGAGGGGGTPGYYGGAGGGLTGDSGGTTSEETNSLGGVTGGGGSQSVGGQGGPGPNAGQTGALFAGGMGHYGGSGGAGYYGGGGASYPPAGVHAGGGGGSSYYGHPQITCGSTEEGSQSEGGGTASPFYVACTNEGGVPCTPTSAAGARGEDGYVLLSYSAPVAASTTSTTIVSDTFTSTSVATSARIVVFQEDVETPTLNTDIIASVSRDGTNFTNATLSDSGYVTGSSGQRILTGQADISGQPSGQSMRWKLALANNAVKIHGVALQWS